MWEVYYKILFWWKIQFFHTLLKFFVNRGNLSSKTIYFQNYKWILIYGKTILWLVLNIRCTCVVQKPWHMNGYRPQSQHYESSACPHPPLQAALHLSNWQHHLHSFGREFYSIMVKLQYLYEKAKGKTVWLRNHHM